jgi:Zn-dependent protease
VAHEIAVFAVWFIVFLFSTTAHEAAHAWVAQKGGDSTAYLGGHVSLDPIPHIKRSPFGMVFVPIISYMQLGFMTGWASVPYDADWGKRHPRRHALMSLAGPATNLLLAAIGIVIIKILLSSGVLEIPSGPITLDGLVKAAGNPPQGSLLHGLAMTLSVLVYLNVVLGLFNLLPVPPLDGAGIAEGAFPRRIGPLYERMRSVPIWQVVGLLVAWNLFPTISQPAFVFVLRLVRSGAGYGT